MKKALLAALLLSSALFAQQGVLVTQDDGPPREFYTKYFFVSGNTTYLCTTKASGELTTQAVSAITNASPASLTITGHGFSTVSRPTITFAGATGSWTPINSTFIATVVDANTLTIALDTSAFGALSGSVVATTSAARATRAIWAVLRLDSDVSNNPVASLWALGGYTNICANRATLSYQ